MSDYFSGNSIFSKIINSSVTEDTSTFINPKAINYFKSIITLSKTKNKKLVVVISPFYKKYTRASEEVIKQICAEENIPLVSYSDSLEFKQQSYFNDENHLNAMGADLFTKNLSQYLKKHY